MKNIIKKLIIAFTYLAIVFIGGVIGVVIATNQYGPYQQQTALDVLNLKLLTPHHNFMIIGMCFGWGAAHFCLIILKNTKSKLS